MDRACSMYSTDDECIQNFYQKNLREETAWEN
jgi:hypothetical protein